MKNTLKSLVLTAAFAGVLASIATPLQATTDATPAPAAPAQAADVRYEIQARLTTSTDMNGAYVVASVTDDAVTLTGYADSQQQHEEALRIAQSYAGQRALVDNISIGGNAIQ